MHSAQCMHIVAILGWIVQPGATHWKTPKDGELDQNHRLINVAASAVYHHHGKHYRERPTERNTKHLHELKTRGTLDQSRMPVTMQMNKIGNKKEKSRVSHGGDKKYHSLHKKKKIKEKKPER